MSQQDILLSGSKANDISTPRFMLWGSVLGFAVDMSIYPASVVGTRLQVVRTVSEANSSLSSLTVP